MIGTSPRIVKFAGSVFPDDADQHSQDVDMVAEDRLLASIGGFEPVSISVSVKLLQSCFALVVANSYDLPVARLLLTANDDVVSVGDMLVDHRISGDPKGEFF